MIDFTLGICCLSRDFPADTRRLTTDWVESDACAVVFQLCQRKHERPTELKNDCACVTYDPVGESRRTSAEKSRLKQQIPNVKSITEW